MRESTRALHQIGWRLVLHLRREAAAERQTATRQPNTSPQPSTNAPNPG